MAKHGGLRICTSSKFSGAAAAASPQTTQWEPHLVAANTQVFSGGNAVALALQTGH